MFKFGKTERLFDNPRSVKTAQLTGCKNISAIERISVIDEIVTCYEKQIVFKNADGGNSDAQTEIFWEFSRNDASVSPDYLRIPPESLSLFDVD